MEYLGMFSNDGEIKVIVRFRGYAGRIPDRRMKPQEICKILDDKGSFVENMTFDEHPFLIEKFEIDPKRKRLVIFAKELE